MIQECLKQGVVFIGDCENLRFEDCENGAEIIEQMIFDMCNEFDISVENAIILVAQYYKTDVQTIKTYLKSIGSEFTKQNNIVYFEDGKGVRLTTNSMRIKKVMEKVCRKMNNVIKDDLNIDDEEIKNVVHCLFYNCRKNGMVN